MQITIFGASGLIGSEVVKHLIDKTDYNLVLFIHNKSPFKASSKIKLVKGDIHNYLEVVEATKGSDLVVSTLGAWGTKTQDILTAGMTNIIPAMEQNKIKRIISLTGSDARADGDEISLLNRFSHLAISVSPARKILKDGEKHIRLLEASDLDYTILRAPVMVNKGKYKNFEISFHRPLTWNTVKRSFVVNSMIDLIKSKDYSRKSPYIKSI